MNVTGVLLAAGLGTRLRPHTEKIPKPLIPVAGIEPLFFNILRLEKLGIKKIIINAHYLPEQILNNVKAWQPLFPHLNLIVEVEHPAILGTGGSLTNICRKYASLIEGGGLLTVNADNISNLPWEHLIGEQNTIAVTHQAEHLAKFNPMWTEEGRYTGVGKSSPTPKSIAAHKTEAHFLNPASVAHLIHDSNFLLQEIDLFSGIYKPLRELHHQQVYSKDLWTLTETPFWFDLGTQDQLLEAQRFIFKNLGQLTLWKDALQKRHPTLSLTGQNIWSTHPCPTNWVGPLIWVGDHSSQTNWKVGPNVYVNEAHRLTNFQPQNRLKQNIEMQDAIVVICGDGADLPSSLSHNICILDQP